jgi:hypothetical protein
VQHDNDVDLAVLDVADWEGLLADLQRLLPQYSMRVVVPSDDPTTKFIRVYCEVAAHSQPAMFVLRAVLPSLSCPP